MPYCEKRHAPNKPIGKACATIRSRIKRLRLERLTALDGLPSEWGEYEPSPAPYKRRTGWYWVAMTKAVSGYSHAGGAGGKYG